MIDEETGDGRYETTGFFDYGAEYDQASFTVLPEGVTAEEMIASSPTWQKAMESIRVSSHSVPVLAVNHLEAMADFAAETAMVTQGRSISQKEYSSGAPVCLISESLARENGLNVGDPLSLSLYEFDRDLWYNFVGEYNPRPSCYLPDQGFQQETEYTIIGLYRQSNEWVTTPTSFTPQQRVRAGEKRQLPHGVRKPGRVVQPDSAKRRHRPGGGPAGGGKSGRPGHLL